MDLYNLIKICQEDYRTDSYNMSIGELMSMYKSEELVTNPLYQREFRWNQEQKSKFIESILLEIPLPSIFIFQDKKTWEVIDGLQRLSTIFQFVGILRDKEKKPVEPFKIVGVKKISAINGLSWNDFDEETEFTFRKVKMDVKIIKDTSNRKTKAKFELFQRLNQKPSVLSGQEYRNALLIMYDEKIFYWLQKLASYKAFKECISGLEERWIKEQYDKELVLRLFVFSLFTMKAKFKKVDDFLDDAIFYSEPDSLLKMITDGEFDLDIESQKFNKTFDFLYQSKGEEVFKSTKSNRGQQFLESLYEAIAIGLYHNIDDYNEGDIGIIINKIDELDSQSEYLQAKGTGTNTEIRIRKLVPFSKNYFRKNGEKE